MSNHDELRINDFLVEGKKTPRKCPCPGHVHQKSKKIQGRRHLAFFLSVSLDKTFPGQIFIFFYGFEFDYINYGISLNWENFGKTYKKFYQYENESTINVDSIVEKGKDIGILFRIL